MGQLFAATAMPDPDWWRVLWADPDRVINALGIEPGMRVIDIGCGDGYFTAAIARRVGPGQVVGLDLDPAMLRQAQVTCEGLANCSWLLGDAREFARLIRAEVDYALIANTFHGAPDKTALAGGVAAALKAGGHFGIVNWHPRAREETTVLGKPRGPATEFRLSPSQTRGAVEPAGFSLESVIELLPYHYGAVFTRTN